MCRYHEICDNNDICSISTPDLKKAVEAYAEMNGLLEHMHYYEGENNTGYSDEITTPWFKNAKFKGMEYEKKYSLEELGITCQTQKDS